MVEWGKEQDRRVGGEREVRVEEKERGYCYFVIPTRRVGGWVGEVVSYGRGSSYL